MQINTLTEPELRALSKVLDDLIAFAKAFDRAGGG